MNTVNAANAAPVANAANAANITPASKELAVLAGELDLISSIINNINTATSKEDSIYIIAAIIGLLSLFATKKAAFQEGLEQQIAPGVTTFANNLKITSSSIALIAGLLAFWALLIESNLRAQGIAAPVTPGLTINPAVSGAISL